MIHKHIRIRLAKTWYYGVSLRILLHCIRLLIYSLFRQILTNDEIKLCKYWWSNSRLTVYVYYWIATSELILNVLHDWKYITILRRKKLSRAKTKDRLKKTLQYSGAMFQLRRLTVVLKNWRLFVQINSSFYKLPSSVAVLQSSGFHFSYVKWNNTTVTSMS